MRKPLLHYLVIDKDSSRLHWSKDSEFTRSMLNWLYELDSPHIYLECNSVVVF